MRLTNTLLLATAFAGALLLTGCATGPEAVNEATSAPSVSNSTANAGDEMFTIMMIPHHEQAIEMADMILAKDGIDPRVTELAQQVKGAQGPEIELMEGWLAEWDVDAPGDMAGHSMGDDGMMGEGDMDALEEASGAEASRLFLEGMIVHHEGAIDMAETELASGQHTQVRELAEQVIDGQSAEIAEMREILGSL
ncbi:protein of unknown function DUF305 [Leucobacter sp. 7(1)]|uniref:DUF305 domain-containing protein n=1 Tax=Leucobacter sp. 7(1) TaxID=1255613 RepID=UPI00097E8E4A|nr:DUF305 domain-containing protein [Leucobacter sp. 7(1)]SJN12157.1 protein of unknown function DUF305 [Leucobacter sp. 7(1)]